MRYVNPILLLVQLLLLACSDKEEPKKAAEPAPSAPSPSQPIPEATRPMSADRMGRIIHELRAGSEPSINLKSWTGSWKATVTAVQINGVPGAVPENGEFTMAITEKSGKLYLEESELQLVDGALVCETRGVKTRLARTLQGLIGEIQRPNVAVEFTAVKAP